MTDRDLGSATEPEAPTPQMFNPPYLYEYSEHGPVTIHDSVNVGWIARVKESLPYKRELAQVIVDALNEKATR